MSIFNLYPGQGLGKVLHALLAFGLGVSYTETEQITEIEGDVSLPVALGEIVFLPEPRKVKITGRVITAQEQITEIIGTNIAKIEGVVETESKKQITKAASFNKSKIEAALSSRGESSFESFGTVSNISPVEGDIEIIQSFQKVFIDSEYCDISDEEVIEILMLMAA